MKLFIQIPCYNEEKTLAATIKDIPKKIKGISETKIVVIDDGSTDRTVDIARSLGVDYIIENHINRGLARTFQRGLNFCLENGADIVVNTDGDNQYYGKDIGILLKPILDKKADLVVGNRSISEINHFSRTKKFLQKFGSFVVRNFSGTSVKDATSGFRAYNREAMLQLNVTDNFTYTLETLIQAGNSPDLTVTSVDVRCNEKLRDSRLIKSTHSYIWNSVGTILRVYMLYKPLFFFSFISAIFFIPSLLIGIRFLINIYILDIQDRTFLPSLVLMSLLFFISVIALCSGLIGLLLANSRELNQNILNYLKRSGF